jgi:ornithine decarboxylase
VLSIGVDSSKIIFANPAKPASHIRHAAAVGVDTMTVDNESELHKITKLFPTAKVIIYL